MKGLDFVFDNDFPSAELRAEFKGLHEHYGVFIDEPFSVADMRRIVAFGTSEGKARFRGSARRKYGRGMIQSWL